MRIIMAIFTDDITIALASSAESDQLVEKVSKRFKLRDLRSTSWLLGIAIISNCANHHISLSQPQHMLGMPNRYRLTDCSFVLTMICNIHLSAKYCLTTVAERSDMPEYLYINVVCALYTWLLLLTVVVKSRDLGRNRRIRINLTTTTILLVRTSVGRWTVQDIDSLLKVLGLSGSN